MQVAAFAMVMTVAIVDIDYAEGHEQAIVSSVSHNVPSLQSQLETMDEQLWGADTELGTDLMQVQTSAESTNSKSQHDSLHHIVEDAL
jgi:hypothetical protein